MNDPYTRFMAELRDIATFNSMGALASWDEQTYMPRGGAEHRARQMAAVSRLVHERFTSPLMGELLAQLEAGSSASDPHADPAVNIRETRRTYDRAVKLPPSLVEEQARTAVLAQQAWVQARRECRFEQFAPWLRKTLELKRQEAACVGHKDHMYDALLDVYEPHETTHNLRRVLLALREPLLELLGRIVGSSRRAPREVLCRSYPLAAQETLVREAAARIGFDFERGRLDPTVHPFCCGIGPGDCRLTTRYSPTSFADSFFSVLHEAGHGLYEQGLVEAHWGTPLGDAVSLGIHESQSRMWENFVGRSRSFWTFFLPRARELFAPVLDDVSLEQFVFAVNDVRPSLIRTEADEVTYNLHIMLRFELEQDLLTGDLAVDDLPAAWNAKMKEYLGLTPPDDAQGCLQDVHWSHGAIGYFPTYALGNLYAAQFFERAGADLGDLDAMFARGEFRPLLEWLRRNIHRHGRRYAARQLAQRVTGEDLTAQPLLRHLNRRAAQWYGV